MTPSNIGKSHPNYGSFLGALALTACALATGCGEADLPDEAGGFEQQSQALTGTYDVGVIPSTDSCPSGSEKIVINMDDEDGSNENSAWGWQGAFVQTNNTKFVFCRVDGQKFKPLIRISANDNYAVLKLGTSCPAGSYGFWKYIDNEDHNNANSSSGTIAPNVVDGNTRLYFCLFTTVLDTTGVSSFPDLGFSYGVFGRDMYLGALDKGGLLTDDEDSNNHNSYGYTSVTQTDATRIITYGPNTEFYMTRVK